MSIRARATTILWARVVPTVCLILSLPTLVGLIVASILFTTHAASGFSADGTSAPAWLSSALTNSPWPAMAVLYVFMGPILACVLAALSWSQVEEAAAKGVVINSRPSKRALGVCAATLCILVLVAGVGLAYKQMFS